MKHVRKISVLLIVSVLMCLCSPFAAAVTEETISFDTYYETLKNEYAQYGIEYSVTNPDPERTFTTQELADACAYAKTVAESVEIEIYTSEPIRLSNQTTPFAVAEDDFALVAVWNVTSIVGTAFFDTYFAGQVDRLGSNIMRFTRFETKFNRGLNYSSHTISSSSYQRDMGGCNVSWAVYGDVSFSWTDPSTGLNSRADVPITNVFGEYNALDYLV